MRLVRRTLSTCPLTLCRCTACVACFLCNASSAACSASSAFCACYVFPTFRLFVASGGAFRCCTRFAWSVQEKLSRTVRMAGLMAYALTKDRGVDLPDTGAWTLVRTKDAKRQRVCIPVRDVVARVFSLASGVASCMLWASHAFYVVCTFDSVTASGFAFPCLNCFARSACSADNLGGVWVSAAAWVSV